MPDQFRLRLSLIDGPELRCPHCGEWWAITTEHWDPGEWHIRKWLAENCPEYLPAYERERKARERVRARAYRAEIKESKQGIMSDNKEVDRNGD